MAGKSISRLPPCIHMSCSTRKCSKSSEICIAPVTRGKGEQEIENPEFTLQELIQQTVVPITTICIDKPLPRYLLHGHYRKIIKRARKVAVEYVQGTRPVLPQSNSVGCVAISSGADNPNNVVKLCFDLRSLYCKGVLVRGVFYELRKSVDQTVFVDGSVALECGESYDKMLRAHNPEIELSGNAFASAFDCFMRLGPQDVAHFRGAARWIGILSLNLLEPGRQKDIMIRMCSGYSKDTDYFKMNQDCWKSIHGWGQRSKCAKGIEYENNGTVVEKFYPPGERFAAIEALNIVNSTKAVPVKRC
ncbi:hypothetical protein ACP4OV_006659 [Aristida adscensionis]